MRLPIFLLSVAAFASAALLRVTDALLPRLSVEFGVGIATAAWVITGYSVAYGAAQLLFGPLGDRFGKLRVIALASGAAGLATLACYFARGFDGLVAARVVAGAFCACIIPMSMAWIGDVVPYENRQPVLARFILGQISGFAVGAAVGGFAAQHVQWRWPFAVLAVWLGVSCVLILRVSRHDPTPRGAAGGHFFADLAGVVTAPWARVVLLTVFIEGMVVFGALAFVPAHLHLARGLEIAHSGLALIAFGVGGAAFALLARAIVGRLGEVGLSLAGALLLSLGLALIAWTPREWVAYAGCFAAGLGFYGLHNTLQTNATQMATQRRGAAMALFASSFFVGQSAGVTLGGAVAERYATTAVLLAAALAVLPVGIVFSRLRKARAAF